MPQNNTGECELPMSMSPLLSCTEEKQLDIILDITLVPQLIGLISLETMQILRFTVACYVILQNHMILLGLSLSFRQCL